MNQAHTRVTDRIWNELFTRMQVATLTQLAVVLVCRYATLVKPEFDPIGNTFVAAAFTVGITRWFFCRGNSLLRWRRIGVGITSILNGFFWGLFTLLVTIKFGILSIQMPMAFVCTCGVVAGATMVVAPFMWIFVPLITFALWLCMAAPLFIDYTKDTWLYMLMVAVYWAFSLVLGLAQRKTFFRLFESEDRIAGEKDRLEHLIAAVPGGVFMVSQEGRYLDLGVVSGQMRAGLKLGFLEPDGDFVHAVRNFLDSRKERDTCEVRGCEAITDDNKRWFLLSLKRATYPELGAVMVLTPLDDYKNAQTEVEKQKAKAQFSSRLAKLGEMAGGIAHEINNPLAVIISGVESARSDLQEAKSGLKGKGHVQELVQLERVENMLQRMNRVAERIGKIVKGLRVFSRQGDRDPFKKVQIQDILQDTLDLCSEKFSKSGVELKIGWGNLEDQKTLELECRQVQISQVLLNLLTNAFDAVQEYPEPKWIKVEVSTLTGPQKNQWIEIRVTDSGNGINPTVAERIFDPFYTTKEVGKGTGLGLSIALGIIEDHGGMLSLDDSNPHTSFVIRLPQSRSSQQVDRVAS